MSLIPYLTFNGCCREAMCFYQSCLGGSLQIQHVADSPFSGVMPQHMRNHVLQSVLISEHCVLMASDMVTENGLVKGNAVSLLLHCPNEAQMFEWYHDLSREGLPVHPPEKTYWGALFGGLTDRFGNHWLLSYHPTEREVYGASQQNNPVT